MSQSYHIVTPCVKVGAVDNSAEDAATKNPDGRFGHPHWKRLLIWSRYPA